MAKGTTSERCTVEELQALLEEEGGFTRLPDNPLDEVYPGLYIGEGQIAQNRFFLRNKGVTHVLNVAKSSDPEDIFGVTSDTELYDKLGIRLLEVEAADKEDFPIKSVFDQTSNFIEEGLSSGGKVLVCCKAGVSRSATVVLAFLMQNRQMTAQEAMRHVRGSRAICPNCGFLEQLCDLQEELAQKRQQANK